ncbi:MAG TPA: TetR/AcrR family transcriptional regulator [Rhodanobacteraceae bacterium]|jgi:AcrR family transcriptional regulator|nr:TetR/AcrR family transcriptional regulator [Rhodanobacteraceae bacterium]
MDVSSDPATAPSLIPHRAQPHARLTAADWERGALEMVAEEGIAALAVEALARRLGVTKGSFYWHFKNREALLQASLARWEAEDERELQNHLGAIHDDPRQRLGALFRWVSGEIQPHRVYAALLQALDHPLVKPVMTRVSQRRMDLLGLAFRQAGLRHDVAQHRARLTYAAYVGFLQLNLTLEVPHLSHEQYEAYVEHLIATLVPGDGGK